MSDKTILKFGGSVITDKSQKSDEVILYDNISKIAGVIAQYRDMPLMIVHGAGSCGHPQAKEFHIQEGVDAKNREGVYKTHYAVTQLNIKMVEILREHGVEAVSVHPLHGCIASDGRLLSYPVENLKKMLEIGIVPVLHGDVVMDQTRGACIVSGDQLISVFANALCMSRVGIATDVSGLLQRDGSVVREVTAASVNDIEITGSGHVDVTGGMKGKVNEMVELLSYGISSDIFHFSKLNEFLARKDHGGTRIVCEVP